jgi:hypothetical protein
MEYLRHAKSLVMVEDGGENGSGGADTSPRWRTQNGLQLLCIMELPENTKTMMMMGRVDELPREEGARKLSKNISKAQPKHRV